MKIIRFVARGTTPLHRPTFYYLSTRGNMSEAYFLNYKYFINVAPYSEFILFLFCLNDNARISSTYTCMFQVASFARRRRGRNHCRFDCDTAEHCLRPTRRSQLTGQIYRVFPFWRVVSGTEMQIASVCRTLWWSWTSFVISKRRSDKTKVIKWAKQFFAAFNKNQILEIILSNWEIVETLVGSYAVCISRIPLDLQVHRCVSIHLSDTDKITEYKI